MQQRQLQQHQLQQPRYIDLSNGIGFFSSVLLQIQQHQQQRMLGELFN